MVFFVRLPLGKRGIFKGVDMKKIRLFNIMVFILSVNIPLAYSLVEPIGSTQEATSKLLVQKERNASLNFKIVHLRRKSFKRNSISARSRAIRSKFRRKSFRRTSFRRNSISAKSRAIRRKFSRRRLHNHN